MSYAVKEAATLREMEDKAAMARDMSRLRFAQEKLARAEHKAPVFRVSISMYMYTYICGDMSRLRFAQEKLARADHKAPVLRVSIS